MIDAVDDAVVEGLSRQNTGAFKPLIQKPLLQPGDEAAENIALAEMHPAGRGEGFAAHLSPVKGGKRDLRFPPILFLHKSLFIQL